MNYWTISKMLSEKMHLPIRLMQNEICLCTWAARLQKCLFGLYICYAFFFFFLNNLRLAFFYFSFFLGKKNKKHCATWIVLEHMYVVSVYNRIGIYPYNWLERVFFLIFMNAELEEFILVIQTFAVYKYIY